MNTDRAIIIRREGKPDLHWSPLGGFAIEVSEHYLRTQDFDNASQATWDLARRSTSGIIGYINGWMQEIASHGVPGVERDWCLRDMKEAKQYAIKAANDAFEQASHPLVFDTVEIARKWYEEIGMALWKGIDALQKYARSCLKEKERLYWKHQAEAARLKYGMGDDFPDEFEYTTAFFAKRHNRTTANISAALGKLQQRVGSNVLRKENGQWVITSRETARKVDSYLRANLRQPKKSRKKALP